MALCSKVSPSPISNSILLRWIVGRWSGESQAVSVMVGLLSLGLSEWPLGLWILRKKVKRTRYTDTWIIQNMTAIITENLRIFSPVQGQKHYIYKERLS